MAKHAWRNLSLDEKFGSKWHPFDHVHECTNCGVQQKKEPLYDGTYGRDGPKVTGYKWTPLAGRCKPKP